MKTLWITYLKMWSDAHVQHFIVKYIFCVFVYAFEGAWAAAPEMLDSILPYRDEP